MKEIIDACEDLKAKLPEKSVFTIIDRKDGFWQIELDESSSSLNTFRTPLGRCSLMRMLFRISSAPEISQKRLNLLFVGIPGASIVLDDVIVLATDDFEHDRILRQGLEL